MIGIASARRAFKCQEGSTVAAGCCSSTLATSGGKYIFFSRLGRLPADNLAGVLRLLAATRCNLLVAVIVRCCVWFKINHSCFFTSIMRKDDSQYRLYSKASRSWGQQQYINCMGVLWTIAFGSSSATKTPGTLKTTAGSSYLSHCLRTRAFLVLKQIRGLRRFDGLAYLCDDAGRTSPRAGCCASPLRVPSKQVGTVAEEANEKVHPKSIKRPRSAESTRISSPAITCIWVSYVYI